MNCIEKCPICGGELQATRSQYFGNVRINARGEIDRMNVTNLGTDDAVYCENDHSLAEMLLAVAKTEDAL